MSGGEVEMSDPHNAGDTRLSRRRRQNQASDTEILLTHYIDQIAGLACEASRLRLVLSEIAEAHHASPERLREMAQQALGGSQVGAR